MDQQKEQIVSSALSGAVWVSKCGDVRAGCCLQKAGGPAPVRLVKMKSSSSSTWTSMNNIWGAEGLSARYYLVAGTLIVCMLCCSSPQHVAACSKSHVLASALPRGELSRHCVRPEASAAAAAALHDLTRGHTPSMLES